MTTVDYRAELVRKLVDEAAIVSPKWRRAFESVPREEFVPRFFLHKPGGGMRAVTEGDDDWLASVYSDLTLVTQLDGDDDRWAHARSSGGASGRPTSSSTQPTLMAWMLEALDIQDGHRILEIGTGTGYNAALLAHRLGSACVTTVDVDADVVRLARERLNRVGYTPVVATADASQTLPVSAPCDRILATCSWPRIPLCWLAQTRQGGLILSHLYTELDAGALVLLTVGDNNSAEGRFLPQYGSFMTRRDYQTADTLAMLTEAVRSDQDGIRAPAAMLATELTSDGFSLFAALRVSGVLMHWFQPEGAPTMRTWLLGRDGSWAYQTLENDELVAVQGGSRRLWDEIETAHREWTRLGRPDRGRFGLTVGPHGHTVWLDEPSNACTWALPDLPRPLVHVG
ncbi:MAG: ATP-grasp peptide maturase system methyltransferase [Sciscionella sp.]